MNQNSNFKTRDMYLVILILILLFAAQPIARALGF